MDSADYSKEAPEDGNAERAGDPSSVLVVGAGPTGLLLASELQRRGVPCHLIDARSGPLHWDRATVVHPRRSRFSNRWDSSVGSSMLGQDSEP
jgi:2-polyprenyl-6-methoxyphenol hydroxylase-like FAD-dependent oxidoreductase